MSILVAGLLLGACNGNDDDPLVTPLDEGDATADDADAEPQPEPEPEPEPDVDDGEVERFAVPAEIDVEYLEAVLDRMHEGLVPGVRSAVAAGEVTW